MIGLLVVAALAPQAVGERKWEQMEYGPFLTAAINLPQPDAAVVPKGVVVDLGGASVCFDTDLLRYAGGWTGGWLTLQGPPFDGNRNVDEKTRPSPRGTLRWVTRAGPGGAQGGDLRDPRAARAGPLPSDRARWKGLYVHGRRVVFSYTLGDCPVLDMPGFETRDGVWGFSRTLRAGPSREPLTLVVWDAPRAAGGVGGVNQDDFSARQGPARRTIALGDGVAAGIGSPGGAGSAPVPEGAVWEVAEGGRLLLKLPPLPSPALFRLVLGSGRAEDRAGFARLLRGDEEDPASFTNGGPARYPEAVVTRGALGRQGGAYEVDTVSAPDSNPWHSWMRFTGLDFFPDGRAALCTWSGDVWVVSGLDEKLEKVRWRRAATGLFQPCGLRVVGDAVYVVGRDQITRLRDRNGDGEPDFYENFNNGAIETGNYHEFAMDLHTDAEGNFYYVKGAKGANYPAGPAQAHHGCLLKVSPDGARLEVVATGIRAGAGMGVGPRGELTVSDNDGHWGPASRLNLVRPGGYYGDPHTAHREPPPKEYDPPLLWIHRSVDNSSGGQVWVTSDRWGPFRDRLLHLSYGTCSLFHVLVDKADGLAQGAVVRFPLAFASGILRGRFHPVDGQLYVCGIKGWTTTANRDGCFQRVRYTGKPVHTVREMRVLPNGLELAFTNPLDAESAGNVENYSAQAWNYRYTEKYGSPDVSVADPARQGRDSLEIQAARVSPDGLRVTLEIAGFRPVMQMMLRFRVRAADGARVAEEVHATIHRVPR
jgi:hypothetical protein